jgi:hypothetical protein
MKKREFKHLALLGLTSGLLLTNGEVESKTDLDKNNSRSNNASDNYDPNNSNIGYHLMTEDELLIELNDNGIKMYNSLDPRGKQLALTVASMRCAKTNPCGGLNACATDKNDCAGKGECKAQGKCAVSDKNLAVKLVYEKMANKRSSALKN